jgi:hypothetical protein
MFQTCTVAACRLGKLRVIRPIASIHGTGLVAIVLCALAASPAAANQLRFSNTWGSSGTSNGQFDAPSGAALGPNGNVYVVDRNNHRVQVFTSAGSFASAWGSFGTGNGQFDEPRGVAVDAGGFVYVTDFNNNRVQKFTSTGSYVTQWGVEGIDNGQFKGPWGIAVDTNGFVYVTEDGLPQKRVQKFTSAGVYVTKWGSGPGSGNGEFANARGISVSADGIVYVCDTFNDRVQRWTTTGTFLGIWGTSGGGNGQFSLPTGVACRGPLVYVVETQNNRVQIFSSNGTYLSKIGTSCNLATSQGCVDPDGGGPRVLGDGQFWNPLGLAVDPADNVFVVDTGNNRMEKFGRMPTSDVPRENSLLDSFGISPNPTPDVAWVRFALPTSAGGRARYGVEARVFDISGRLVRELYAGEMDGGEHVLYWDGTAPGGATMGPGVFFLRVGVNGSLQRSVKIVRLGH